MYNKDNDGTINVVSISFVHQARIWNTSGQTIETHAGYPVELFLSPAAREFVGRVEFPARYRRVLIVSSVHSTYSAGLALFFSTDRLQTTRFIVLNEQQLY